ncbi:MAG: SPFH domain-containing protein, partial [Bacteroidota bacterium]|nr:SPFH domain-containing protein [Bacteroidota bacterium]
MKYVKINTYQVGLVFSNGTYKRLLGEGNYFFWKEDVQVYDVTRQFYAPVELNILLQDEALRNALYVIEVRDNEIALQYENGLLKQVLTAGRYTFWKGIVDYEFVKADTGKIDITENISRATLQHALLMPYVRTYTVESFEKGLLFVDGNYVKALNSGVYYWWKNSIAINIGKVDMRMQQAEINGQEILTKDKAALRINGQAQYKVVDIEKALLENKEYEKQLYVAFQLALREYIGGFSFDELLEKKETIAPFILKAVSEKALALGIEVI